MRYFTDIPGISHWRETFLEIHMFLNHKKPRNQYFYYLCCTPTLLVMNYFSCGRPALQSSSRKNRDETKGETRAGNTSLNRCFFVLKSVAVLQFPIDKGCAWQQSLNCPLPQKFGQRLGKRRGA